MKYCPRKKYFSTYTVTHTHTHLYIVVSGVMTRTSRGEVLCNSIASHKFQLEGLPLSDYVDSLKSAKNIPNECSGLKP